MPTKVITAVASPELPRDAWITGGISPEAIDGFVQSLTHGEDAMSVLKGGGVKLTNIRIHTQRKPSENDFIQVTGFDMESLELRRGSDLETAQYLGFGFLAITGAQGTLEIDSLATISSSNSFLITREPSNRFAKPSSSLQATLEDGFVGTDDETGILLTDTAYISPLDSLGVSTPAHLLRAHVEVNDALLDMLKT